MTNQPESPFSAQQTRLTFGLDWILLLTLVAAATATLVGYALFLPSVTSELNAWLGKPAVSGDGDNNRRAHIVFLVLCYAAPMILGLAVRLVHSAGKWVALRLNAASADDENFRME